MARPSQSRPSNVPCINGECPQTFNRREDMLRHVKAIHEGVFHFCSSCEYKSKRLDVVRKHHTKYHSIEYTFMEGIALEKDRGEADQDKLMIITDATNQESSDSYYNIDPVLMSSGQTGNLSTSVLVPSVNHSTNHNNNNYNFNQLLSTNPSQALGYHIPRPEYLNELPCGEIVISDAGSVQFDRSYLVQYNSAEKQNGGWN